MDDGEIVAQGTFDEMNKVKEFKEIMDINDLNKNLEEKKDTKEDKGSAEGDTESMGDSDEPEGTVTAPDLTMEEKAMTRKTNKSRKSTIKK
jgi:hypothetical protein